MFAHVLIHLHLKTNENKHFESFSAENKSKRGVCTRFDSFSLENESKRGVYTRFDSFSAENE